MPEILFAWTSATGTALPLRPKQIFFPGDDLQFNVIHTALPGERSGTYVVTYFHEHLGLSFAEVEDSHFEVLWPVRLNYNSPLQRYDGIGPYLDYWSIPRIEESPPTFIPDSRHDALTTLRESATLLAIKGYWRFTVFVEAMDENNKWNFATKEWIYHLRETELM